jgi:ABC-type uncharacterized transport system substrate-binding protein
MKRRDFITLMGGAAASWPVAARAQQRPLPVVGILYAGTVEANLPSVQAVLKGLSQTGFVDGQNVAVEYRYAGGQFDRLPELAAELVHRRVFIIVTPLSVAAALAAKAATATISIVFSTGVDPVQVGLVASLNRPGGNVTGILTMSNEIGSKRLGLLHELLPSATRFGVLVNFTNSLVADAIVKDLQAAASILGRQIEFLPAGTIREIDAAFASFVQQKLDALLVSADAFLGSRSGQILTLAARHAIPTIYTGREDVAAGGLMGYNTNQTEVNRQVGLYAGRVLKGEKPADLPVARPTKFEFVINGEGARHRGAAATPCHR